MITETLFHEAGKAANELAEMLTRHDLKVVFAESCTAGLVSATMAGISGISSRLCGSAVTYRVPVKESWLGIDPELIETRTAVSPEVTRSMAEAVLEKTDDATLALGITGHLEGGESEEGPLAYVFVCDRVARESPNGHGPPVSCTGRDGSADGSASPPGASPS